ncbi:uncharacterized protein LOC116112090 isoform X2 [Pistacia vera]|uniref:uncharacterized protein LOC116112090 isoform X2 n=1 Tax=Pistacia vera TaxID=55513 RepID=UPI001263803A|nr:uncharacterized protein LOC116112090 isoform X2 [Pistacia vera]
MVVLQSDLRSGTIFRLIPLRSNPDQPRTSVRLSTWRASYGGGRGMQAAKRNDNAVKLEKMKPKICTADELHYVPVSNSDWRLALWRYLPSSKSLRRNHPLLLLSGVGTNAIGYDLSPQSSFARFMSGQGFDTWILEVRGAGLSTHGEDFREVTETLDDSDVRSVNVKTTEMFSENEQSKSASKLSEIVMQLSERLLGFLSEGPQSVTPQLFELHERLSTSIGGFRRQLDLIMKNDWDFDHYLEEDVPAVMEYIRTLSKPEDGKLLAVGHSMGGILLYAMLSRYGKDSGLASVTTLASSLDYRPSKSSLRLLLPLADPLQTLNVPAVPLGVILAAAHPFASYPPYILSWVKAHISAVDMMHPDLFEKLIFNNFCNIPSKLLLQLSTVFQEGGLSDRTGTFFYKDHLGKSNVPVLALAGDQDLICPSEAVYETVKLFPKHLATYKVFGEPSGPHYAHYDLVGGRLAVEQVYPCIIEFLSCHDMT